jgi:hypothetical protein
MKYNTQKRKMKRNKKYSNFTKKNISKCTYIGNPILVNHKNTDKLIHIKENIVRDDKVFNFCIYWIKKGNNLWKIPNNNSLFLTDGKTKYFGKNNRNHIHIWGPIDRCSDFNNTGIVNYKNKKTDKRGKMDVTTANSHEKAERLFMKMLTK